MSLANKSGRKEVDIKKGEYKDFSIRIGTHLPYMPIDYIKIIDKKDRIPVIDFTLDYERHVFVRKKDPGYNKMLDFAITESKYGWELYGYDIDDKEGLVDFINKLLDSFRSSDSYPKREFSRDKKYDPPWLKD